MENLKKDFDRLIMDYLSNNLTDDERIILKESLKDESNKKAFREKVQVYWTLQNVPVWKQLDDAAAWGSIQKRLYRRNRFIILLFGFEALLVLALGCVLFF